MAECLSVGVIAICIVALAGCKSSDASAQGDTAVLASSAGFTEDDIQGGRRLWPFWPVSMRVHPLTRISIDDDSGKPLLEARVEFRDLDSVPSRCCGIVRLALHRKGELPKFHAPIQTWEVDLRDIAKNSRRFDVVTQTYLFKLEIEKTELNQGETLWALYLGGDGIQLEDSRTGFSIPR